MGDKIKVNTVRLATDAEKVNTYINNIEKAMKQIEERVKKIDNMWDGDASKAFKNAITGDLESLKIMIQNLKEVYKYEMNAKSKYETCESKVAELVAQIKA